MKLNKKAIAIALDNFNPADLYPFIDQFVNLKVKPVMKINYATLITTKFEVIDFLNKNNFLIFLDLKFHDIPATVGKAVQQYSPHANILTLHAQGGLNMLETATNNLDSNCNLAAISILTSTKMNYENESDRQQLIDLVSLPQQAHIACLVTSVPTLTFLKPLYPNFYYITPGIRIDQVANDDQKLTATPHEASLAGSNMIVVGRPITQSSDPVKAYLHIAQKFQMPL